MKRTIIRIDQEKCNGCGLCVTACHEGAIGLVDGKAQLLRDDYCDGMGDCLPNCPTGAISFEQREAAAYDAAAVKANQQQKAAAGGCPGTKIHNMNMENHAPRSSQLRQWPAQIKLVPTKTAYFEGADLLIAADCTAYAYGNFHEDFMKGKVTLIGCPKLDDVDYSEKLGEILRSNDIQSVTVTRMEVPCCGGLEWAVKKAILSSGKQIGLSMVTIGIDGNLL